MKKILSLLVFLAALGTLSANSPDTYWVNAKIGLILRNEPNRNANRILVMPYGSIVHLMESSKYSEVISGHKGTWVKVNFGKNRGWAFSGFLTSQKPKNSLFKWNNSQSRFLILINKKGFAEDCGNGYAEQDCEVTVFQNEKIIFQQNVQQFAEWRNDSEIILSSGVGECVSGELNSEAIDITTGKQTGTTHSSYARPGCGMPNEEEYETIYTSCSNKKCATFRVSKSMVIVYIGLPDYRLKKPFNKLHLLAKQQLKGKFGAPRNFDGVTFNNGKNKYIIDFITKSLQSRSQP